MRSQLKINLWGQAKAWTLSILALSASGIVATAFAADLERQKPAVTEKSPLSPDWLITMQIGPGISPTYPGSAFYRPVPIPGISLRRADEPERFSAPDDGFGVQVFEWQSFRAGPVGNLVIPRWMTHGEVYGLRKLKIAVEAGGFVEYFPEEHLRLRAELRQGFYGHHGLVGSFAADFIEKYRQLTFSAGPRMNMGARQFEKAYYSISPSEALVNGHVKPFRATGGLSSVGFMSSIRYDVTPVWNVTAYGGYLRLTGSAAASPIPSMLGSPNQMTAGVLVAHTFSISGF